VRAAAGGRTVRRVLRSALLVLAWSLVLFGCSAVLGGGAEAPGLTGRVVRVVDGDTIHVEVGGTREKVRYIGVDTPETRRPPECFGAEATQENARLVAGEAVRLTLDAEARDRYGRLLAYVHRVRDGAFVNAALVRQGFAEPLTVAPNVRRARELRPLARAARAARRGLWGACRSQG